MNAYRLSTYIDRQTDICQTTDTTRKKNTNAAGGFTWKIISHSRQTKYLKGNVKRMAEARKIISRYG
jgi:hypothetical protein